MLKNLADITFEEFSEWANRRACDGRWDLGTAIVSSELCSKIYSKTRFILFKRRRKKNQNELFEKYKPIYFQMDSRINVSE